MRWPEAIQWHMAADADDVQDATPRSRRRVLAAGLGLAAVAALPARALARLRDPIAEDWIPPDAFLDDLPRQMRALGVPGVGIAVVERGEPVWTRGFGVMHAGRATPVDDATLFEVASLSKPVFAWLALQLVDRGELALDRPLVHYLRPQYLGHGPWVDAITTRDVLRHSTGLPDWRKDPAHEMLVPAVAPGTRIDYSGEAFFWLQRVLEAITGESLDQSMRRRLFDPAGMGDSSYAWDERLAARSVYGHGLPGATQMPPQGLRDQWQMAQAAAGRHGQSLHDWRYADAEAALAEAQAPGPAGLVVWPGDIMANAAASLRCTVGDYARFMALMVRGHSADWELRDETRKAMLTPQIQVPGRWSDKTLGWNLEATPQGAMFFHSGSNAGIFKSFALGDAVRQRALVVATNATLGNLLYRRVVRAATGLDLLAFDA